MTNACHAGEQPWPMAEIPGDFYKQNLSSQLELVPGKSSVIGVLRAVGVKDTGRGPPGFTGGSGGMLGGEDLDCIFTSTGDPGITGTLFSPATVRREGGNT